MIGPDWLRAMARYNRWQNESLCAAAAGLPAAALTVDRGAFFGSILATFNHLLWADAIWLSRLAGTPGPDMRPKEALTRHGDLAALREARNSLDAAILAWADGDHGERLTGELVWQGAIAVGERRAPYWLAATHMFNHQTHHRGQIHAMLTAAGARPDDTDLILMQMSPPA